MIHSTVYENGIYCMFCDEICNKIRYESCQKRKILEQKELIQNG